MVRTWICADLGFMRTHTRAVLKLRSLGLLRTCIHANMTCGHGFMRTWICVRTWDCADLDWRGLGMCGVALMRTCTRADLHSCALGLVRTEICRYLGVRTWICADLDLDRSAYKCPPNRISGSFFSHFHQSEELPPRNGLFFHKKACRSKFPKKQELGHEERRVFPTDVELVKSRAFSEVSRFVHKTCFLGHAKLEKTWEMTNLASKFTLGGAVRPKRPGSF